MADDEKVYVTGTHVPENQYHHPPDPQFKHVIIPNKISSAAGRGLLSSDSVAAIAALLKSNTIHPYGNTKGMNVDFQGINDAYFKAVAYEEANPEHHKVNHNDITALLSNVIWFYPELTTRRLRLWNARKETYDIPSMIANWDFPNPPQEQVVRPRGEESGSDGDDSVDERELVEPSVPRSGDSDYFAIHEERVEIKRDDTKSDESDKDPNLARIRKIKYSQFVLADKSDNYESQFMNLLKSVINYRSDLIKNIANHRKKSLIYNDVKGELNAYNHRMMQYLVSFRVYHHLVPASHKFGRLLCLKGRELQTSVIHIYVKQFEFLQKKGFINKNGERIKSYESLNIIPKETYKFKQGKVQFIPKQKVRERAYTDWDELELFQPHKKRKVDHSVLDLEDDDEYKYPISTPPPHSDKHVHTPPPSKYLRAIMQKQDDLALSLGILSSKNSSIRSPQQQSVDDMLNSDKRGVTRWSHEHYVNKTVLGFELIAEETRTHQQHSLHQDLYQKMANKKRGKQIVDEIQDSDSEGSDSSNPRKKRKKRTRSKLDKRFDSELELLLFIWRVNPNTISEIMLNLIRYAENTQNLIRARITTTINNIFKCKDNIFKFITEVHRLITIWSLHISHSRKTIVANLNHLYSKKKIKCNALREFECYSRMLSVATNDWREFERIIKILVDDPQIDAQLFYNFVNKVFNRSFKQRSSIVMDVQNTHLRQQLNLEKVSGDKSDELWMQHMFRDYEHIKLLKDQRHLSDTKPSVMEEFGAIPKSKLSVKRTGLTPQERKTRTNRLHRWMETTRSRLKSKKHKGELDKMCAAHHMDEENCSVRSGLSCNAGNQQRLHICICGSTTHNNCIKFVIQF